MGTAASTTRSNQGLQNLASSQSGGSENQADRLAESLINNIIDSAINDLTGSMS